MSTQPQPIFETDTTLVSKNTLSRASKALIFVQNIENVGGFVFDISVTTQHQLESDITDHYVEDNTAIQDHWAIKPEMITLKNYQGELVYTPQQLTASTQRPPVKLNVHGAIITKPQLQQTQQLQNGIIAKDNNSNNIDTTATDLASQFNGIQSSIGSTRQQKAYEFFKTIRENRILITAVTPYGTFSNIAIANIVPFQDEETKYMSTFTLTLKELRFANFLTVSFNPATYQGRAAVQAAPSVTHRAQGQQVPPPPTNLIQSAINAFGNPLSSNPLGIYGQFFNFILNSYMIPFNNGN